MTSGSRPSDWRRPRTRPTTSPSKSGATRSASRRSASCGGATFPTATRRTGGAWPTSGPAARAARSTSTAARISAKARSASRTIARRAHAGSRSGTSCSWSSSCGPTGRCTPLPAPGVDTGMGLERLASVVQQVPTNYDTDLFTPIHARMRELLGHDPDAFEQERFSYQVIADHSRAVTFLIARRRPSAQRGPRLRPATHPPARGPPRAAARPAGAVHGRHGRCRHRRDVRRLSVPDREARTDPRTIAREEAQFARTLDAGTVQLEEALIPLTSAASRRRAPPGGPAGRRAEASRRRRVPAARHLWLPGRPDRRAGGRIRRRHRPRRLRRRARRAARAQPIGQEGRARQARRAARRSTARSRAASATPNSSATRPRRLRAGSSRSSATGWSSTS